MYVALAIYFLILHQKNLAIKPYQKPKIIGGTACTLDNKTSFMVALTSVKGDHYCGGSLVNPSWVLTAAHCKQKFTLYASDIFTRAKYVDKKGVLSVWTPVIKIIEIIMHPEYSNKTKEHDIALMKLEKKMRATRVHTVKLPTSKVNAQPPQFCPTAATMGWGDINRDVPETPTHLQCIELKTITNAKCAKLLSQVTFKVPKVYKSGMCTGVNKKQGTCYGDSGGPLMCGDVQYGIVSWGVKCADKYPNMYTRVDHHLSFISEHATKSINEGLHHSSYMLLLIIFILFNKILS